MSQSFKSFKDLRVWQKGMEVVEDTYKLTKKFPKEELYGLTSQVRRAAVSIPSNIAEGFRRYHTKENKQFLYVALASMAELETQLIISKNLFYINESELNDILQKIEHLSRMITLLRQRL